MNTGFLTPQEVAEQVATNCCTKVRMPIAHSVLLGILAGAYIAFGAQLFTMVTHDLTPRLGLGLTRFIGGSVFSLGLMLVVLGGAELFTGNCLLTTSVLGRRISMTSMLRNWAIVYPANFAGALLVAGMVYYTGQWKMGDAEVGAAALTTATAKVSLSFAEAFWRGVACNWLVCLAVWLAVAGRDVVSKILGIYFPIMAFVASGFEHSIANMYFIPLGLFLKANPAAVIPGHLESKISALTWEGFLVGNLVPVTLGNIVGGVVFVGVAYYYAYLRADRPKTETT